MPSIAIGKILYDPAARQLFVDFVSNGRRYVYLDVPPETASAFRSSFGKSTFFKENIRDRFDCELLYDPNWGKSKLAG